MRVQGNAIPDKIRIWPNPRHPGMVEVRLMDNPVALDPDLWTYDEYIMHLAARPGLAEDIHNHFDAWMETAKSMEISQNASALVEAQQERDNLLEDLAAMVEDVYQMDLEMMED